MKKLLLLLSSAAVCAVESYVPPSMALNGFSLDTSTAVSDTIENMHLLRYFTYYCPSRSS